MSRSLPAVRARRPELEKAVASLPVAPSLAAALHREDVAVIAEVKRRSPSAGDLAPHLDPVDRAACYAEAGASAISVLTEPEYFGGSVADLAGAAGAVTIPVLRKDFILDEAQIIEARAAGAAAVLLLVRAMDPGALRRLIDATVAWGLEALVEVHDAGELATALECGATILGVNSRDLGTFLIDSEAAWPLLGAVPTGAIAVAESGTVTRADVERAAEAGADAVLVGGALSRHENPDRAVRELVGVQRRGR